MADFIQSGADESGIVSPQVLTDNYTSAPAMDAGDDPPDPSTPDLGGAAGGASPPVGATASLLSTLTDGVESFVQDPFGVKAAASAAASVAGSAAATTKTVSDTAVNIVTLLVVGLILYKVLK